MKKTGIVESLNVSPKGFHEGFLLRAGNKIIQVNLPKHERDLAKKELQVGEKVTVDLEPEKPHGDSQHEVFRLLSLPGTNGNVAKTPHPEALREFSGSIERLNYALHGAVNGGILDSGDFLHLKPAGARALKLKLGMHVEGKGHTKPMADGHSVIEPETVNGVELEIHTPKKKKHAPKRKKH